MAASTPTKILPQGCTNLKLRQLMRRVSQFYDVEMARAGLKTTQYSLLSYVDKLGPVRPGELAAGLKMDASTLTRNLRPLVDAGWVLVSAGDDARSRLVSLTPAGREKRAEAKRRWKVAQEGINRLLGVEQVVALHTLIDASMDKLDPVDAVEVSDE
ncbi:MAG: winged helix-turn-helix transcriptional regulator [Hydrogenophaga sp.]|uniref:MarR family winged helix-turn-helix transcriptional regulator n=1 Tax=Hydrogenophaga sp. TaxID=1904254 RepID=UPI0025C154B3|nr:MarR family winged helix-turn-helix transcriptional regulator [Hydrogenophaga sp.]MBT9552187.1 winged helix-turn-helix transcriptional regulator [Hydrogenophaga sp.]